MLSKGLNLVKNNFRIRSIRNKTINDTTCKRN